ncbi:MAG TPA: hypothetical protein VIL37_12645 [Natronosporangium sp.]
MAVRMPAWPLTGLLLLYPLWWVLGLGVLIFPIAAVPMAVILLRQRFAGRPIRFPPGFALWLLFLAVVVLGIAALDATPAGTVPAGSGGGKLAGAGYRIGGYLTLTVLLLYAGNLRESELPRRRLVWLLAGLFMVTVAGGLVGTFAGHLELTSPVELLLPGGWRGNSFVQSLVHPYAAQIMDVGSGAVPRPAAPWGYTNTWGNNVVMLAGWFVAATWALGARRPLRLLSLGVLALALIPVVHSLNRGMWIGLAVVAGWVAIRLALRGRLTVLVAGAAAVLLLGLALAASPLGDTVRQRLEYGRSDGVRAYLSERAVVGMAESPVIGFGSTRSTQGGRHSIAIGPTPDCEQCGSFTVGGNGQLWQLLFAHGLLGTVAYLGFFGYALWRFRKDGSPIGLAGSGALVGSFVSTLWYNALVTPLAFAMLSYALLWRNSQRDGQPASLQAGQRARLRDNLQVGLRGAA